MAGGTEVSYETTSEEAQRLIATAIANEPRLTHFGIGVYEERQRRRTEGDVAVNAAIEIERGKLLGAVDEVRAAADWIKRQRPVKAFNTRHTSYGYKHAVERWWRDRGVGVYVANGSFIAAAIGLGWDAKVDPSSPNVLFKFSEQSVSAPTLDA